MSQTGLSDDAGISYFSSAQSRHRVEPRSVLITMMVKSSSHRMYGASDQAIIATADDALIAKHAAVEAGYYQDPYIAAFSRGERRHVQPLIKRGTHARVCCIDRAITSFVNLIGQRTNGRSDIQVVVLGAGKDTSFFRYQAGLLMGHNSDERPTIRWYEVDHISMIQEKATMIQKSSLLDASAQALDTGCFVVQPARKEGTCFLIGHDLREDPGSLLESLSKNGLDRRLPTLFISECVQMYLPEPDSQRILQVLVESFQRVYLCCYEPILGSDAFGKVMEKNLIHAGVAGPNCCMIQTRTLSQHLSKLKAAGFVQAVGCDMWSAYETVITPEQRRRADQCEFLDELEEWMLIMRHYSFIVGSTDSSAIGKRFCEGGKGSLLGFVEEKSQRMSAVNGS